ncbi:MAG TPA: hypothetical protein DCQ93_02245, partial [Bacteroidetes bacterium]|nr:hypothetical protein [Bacteroidota bacterium]
MKKKVALLLDNNLTIDRRALLETESLASLDIELHLFCMKGNAKPDEEQKENYFIHRIFTPEIYIFRRREKILSAFAEKILETKFEIIHCHDRVMLHLGTLIRKKNPDAILIYESRELFHQWPLHVSAPGFMLWLKSWLVRRLEVRREKIDGSSADYLITVNESISEILQKYFNLKNAPVVTRNIPRYEEVKERSNYLRKKFSIPAENKIVVYIGAHLYRHTLRMEQALSEFSEMKNLSVVIITGDDSHSLWFKEWVKQKRWTNIFFHELIPISKITEVLSGCDAGIVSAWNKKDLSYWLALDNKIFSYIMAEIPVLATAQPEYAKAVEGNNCGVCINPETSGAFAEGLNKIFSYKEKFPLALKA